MLRSSLLILFVSSALFSFSQKANKATFVQINVVQLDPVTEDVMDSWETRNYCTYEINSKGTKISYKEKTPKGKVVKEWEYPIVNYNEDETVYTYMVKKENGIMKFNLWKDKTMVSLVGSDAIYLVAGALSSAR